MKKKETDLLIKKQILKKTKDEETFIIGIPITFLKKREVKLIILAFIAGVLMTSGFWWDYTNNQQLYIGDKLQIEYCVELGKNLNASSTLYIGSNVCQIDYCREVSIMGFPSRNICLMEKIYIGEPNNE